MRSCTIYNYFKFFTRYTSMLRTILILLAFFSQAATAADYACKPTNGTLPLNYAFGDYQITDPEKNTPGTIVPEKTLDSPSATTAITCSCSTTFPNFWLWADTPLTGGSSDGSYVYYDLPGNEYLQAGIQIKSSSDGAFSNVPFGPSPNFTATYPCTGGSIKTGGENTGGQIKISLRIKKSFVGNTIIPNTLLASTYWTIGDTGGTAHGPTAFTNIYVSGNVTVPQNCVINAGTQMVVDLGSFYTGDFSTVGQKPENYTPKTFNVPIKCNDISASANLTLRIQGTPSAGVPDAMQSDNKDIGVVITDSTGNILRPSDTSSTIPFLLDTSNSANVTLHAYPVSTTGNTPAEGLFTTLAYLRVDFS